MNKPITAEEAARVRKGIVALRSRSVKNKPITAEQAARVRKERGLLLPTNREYANPRLKEITVEMEILVNRLNALDLEIANMAK